MTKIRMLLPVLLVLGACATRSSIEESRNYARLGEHARAFELIDAIREDQLRSGQPVDPEFEREYTEQRKQYLLDLGRQDIFAEHEEQALVDLAGVLAIEPDHEEALMLRERARLKQAMRSTANADDFLFKKELEGALRCYLEAERFVPGYPPAVEGAENVRQAVLKLTERAQQQFLEAVRKVPEFRFVEVRWHTANVMTNDPTRADAELLKQRANHEIAKKTFARGLECQAQDKFGAALVEFRSAKLLWDAMPGVDDAIAQMRREVEAAALVEKASMLMRSGRFDDSRTNLDKAFQLSKLARAGISELMIETRRLESEKAFELCRDLEILGRKREALAAYEAITVKWPKGVKDEKNRIDGLRTDIEGAEKEWALGEAAEAKKDLPEALEHFQASERYYGAYKNAKDRIAVLKERIAAAASGTGS